MSVEVAYLLIVPLFFAAVFVLMFFRIEVGRLSNAEAIEAVIVTLGKAKDEIVGRIGALEAAAEAAGVAEDLSGPLANLVAAAQALDDVVPDAVVSVEDAVEEPVEVVGEAEAPVEG